ncbi:MAG: hypothetical protein GF383_08770 [Candidatus Lokiarchaeota archaeon]|nr:hypothetical protein [Candidatus Lokiarchaeota archaeon]
MINILNISNTIGTFIGLGARLSYHQYTDSINYSMDYTKLRSDKVS